MNSASRAVVPLCLAFLALLTAALLFPYLALGRSLVPLDLLPHCQPWATRARELWGQVPPIQNPLLDSLQQYFPRRVYMASALRGGWLPLWNPYVYGGSPFLATQQGSVLYPPAWLLALLPAELQFGWSAFFHLLLAGAGTFFFLRELELRPSAALAGAAAFAFNGFMLVWLAYPNVTQWTLCWLPLSLFCGERALRRSDPRWSAASALTLALNVLGGHGQSSEYGLLVWGAWMLVRVLGERGGARGVAFWVALPAALGFCLALGHLLPVLEYVPRTDRGARVGWEAVVSAGMPPSQLWTFLLPRLFGDGTASFAYQSWLPAGGKAGLAYIERSFYPGVAVLALACAARLGVRHKPELRRLFWFSVALAITGVLLAMATPLYWPFWCFLPGFTQFTAVARIICVDAWAFACLAALGVQALTEPDAEIRARCLRPFLSGGFTLAAVAGIGYFIYAGAAPPNVSEAAVREGRRGPEFLATLELLKALGCLVAPMLLAVLVRARRGKVPEILSPAIAGLLATLLVAADLTSFGAGYNPATETRYLQADPPELQVLAQKTEPFRFLSTGPAGQEMDLNKRMPSNLPSIRRLADISGSDSFLPRRYVEWQQATQTAGGGSSPWARLGSPNLRSAGVRFYLGAGLSSPGLSTVGSPLLLEDARALPYARLHTNAQRLSHAEVLRNLAVGNRAPEFALVSGTGAPEYDGPPHVTPFKVRRLSGNRLEAEGESSLPGLLVVCEGFDPGWRVRVDGQPGRLFPADHVLLGIPLEKGHHRVELEYAPASFRVGAFGSLLALAVLVGIVALTRRPRTDVR